MKEMYNDAESGNTSSAKPTWLKVQELAFRDDKTSFDELTTLILDAERRSIRLPVIRSARKTRKFIDKKNKSWTVEEGDTIIMDIVRPYIIIWLTP